MNYLFLELYEGAIVIGLLLITYFGELESWISTYSLRMSRMGFIQTLTRLIRVEGTLNMRDFLDVLLIEVL